MFFFDGIDDTVVVMVRFFGPGDGCLSSSESRSSSSSALDASGEKAIPRFVNSSKISIRLLGEGGIGGDDEEVPSSSMLLLLLLSVEDEESAVVEAAAPTACL